MRTANGGPSADLTARARIRDAAVLRFAIDGFGVGLRAIAAEAGVTPGLITHHFGTKANLRAECDEHVLGALRAMKLEALTSPGTETALAQLMSIEQYAPLTGYLARSLQAGGELAAQFLDHLVADADDYLELGVRQGTIKPSRNPSARARHLTLQGVGALVIHISLRAPQTAAELAVAVRELANNSALPALELYTEGLLMNSALLDAILSPAAPSLSAQR